MDQEQSINIELGHSRAKNSGLFFSILLLVLFWFQLFNQLRAEWSANDQYAYGWFVPVLAVVLFWRRYQDRPLNVTNGASRFDSVWWTALLLALVLLLLPLRLVEEANFRWRGVWLMHSLILVALSLLLIRRIGGPSRVRHFAFPVLFLLVGVPWITTVEGPVVLRLMRVVAGATIEIVRLFGIPAVRHGNLIEVGSGVVSVDGACSGVRSLQTSLMLTLLFGEAFRLRLWLRVALVPLGFALAFLANVARTSLLTWGAATHGMDFMERRLHDPAGVGVVVVVLAGIYLTALGLSRKHSVFSAGVRGQGARVRAEGPGVRGQESGVSGQATEAGTADQSHASPSLTPDTRPLTPELPPSLPPDTRPLTSSSRRSFSEGGCHVPITLVAFAAAWLVFTEAATAYWFHLGDLRSVTNPIWSVNWPTNAPGYAETGLTKTEREMLRCDDAKRASWQDETSDYWSLIALRWGPENENAFNGLGHSPDVCFVSAGWQLRDEPEPVWVPVNGIEMPFRRFVFEVDGRPAYAFMGFWDERSPGGQQEPGVAYGVRQRVKAAWKGKRLQGLKKLEIAIIGPASADDAVPVLRNGLERLIVIQGSAGSGHGPLPTKKT